MSEPIPEAVPTSADPRSRRPVKRARVGNTAIASQADEIDNLMWNSSRPIHLPALSSESKSSSLAPPPEIVANVQGSSAGAGSGEFHVYKASRRRENERLRLMDEEAKKEEDEKEWAQEEKLRKERDEERTRKNREKRNKKKKGKEKNNNDNKTEESQTNGLKKKVNSTLPSIQRRSSTDNVDDTNGGSDFAVAEVAGENGLTIHDED